MLGGSLRRVVPSAVAGADLAWCRRVVRMPVLGAVLPRLSAAADRSKLRTGPAAALALRGGRAALRGLGVLSVVAAGAVGSRVASGAHYPDDVVAAALVGSGLAFATGRVGPFSDGAPAEGAAAEPGPRPGPDGDGLVIVAHSQAGPALLPDPADRLAKALPAATVIDVTDPGELQAALDHACRHARAIGIAGGDGSVSAAAGRAHTAGVPLLVVPAGTLNRLASDLGHRDVDDAVAAVHHGQAIRLRLAEIGDRTFVNAATLGIYPSLVDVREQLEGRIGKWAATMLALGWSLLSCRPVDVELDGTSRRIWLLFAGNGRFPGPGIAPTRRRRLDDEVFDVRIVRADLPWGRTRLVIAALLGRVDRAAALDRHVVDRLAVRASGLLRATCDGEAFTAPAEFVIGKRPGPLTLLVTPDR